MGKKIKKKNLRKSESDIRSLGRGSSSGSNSTDSGLTRNDDASEHEILIDKLVLKQVRVENLKDREFEEIDDGGPEVEEVPKDQKLKQPSKSLELELVDILDHSDGSRSKTVTKHLPEEEVDSTNTKVVKLYKSPKRDSGHHHHDNSSTPPPLRKEHSHTPEDHHQHHEHVDHDIEPELHHPRYLNQAYWDPKPSSSTSYYLQKQKRIPSPFLPPPGMKLSAHSRLRLHLTSSSLNPPRRPGPPKEGNTAQRIASAKRMTIMDLKSKIKQLQDEIEKLKKENRFLNHLHHRQDNALRKWEGKDAELPRLLNQHKDEIRALQQQLRRAQQQTREGTEKLTMREKKIFRLEAELDKLRSLVHEEHLQDRHQLQEDLDITRMNLTGAEKRIREYMKHVDILEKNHRHQLVTQERKLLKVNSGTYELQQLVANLRLALRNKDRMLNYIQMRSSGRNLIRAFHAEKAGIEDVLYGTSIIDPGIVRPYPPPPDKSQLMKVQKPESTATSKSECFGGSYAPTIPDFDAASQLSSTRRAIESTIQRTCNNIVDFKSQQRHREEEELPKRPLSKHSRSLDSMIKVSIMSPRSMNDDKKLEITATPNFTTGTATSSTVGAQKKSNMKQESQQNSNLKNQTKDANRSSDRNGQVVVTNPPKEESSKEDISSKPPKGPVPKRKDVSFNGQKVKTIAKPVQISKPDKKNNNNQTVKASQGKIKTIKSIKSKELVYRATDSGFKYEGPFVKKNKGKITKEESAEILYTAKSEKISDHSSESSSSTSCSFSEQSSSSSRSEMLSNIDILSARIRESCVMVPPPEANLSSPRNAKNSSYALKDTQSDIYFDVNGNNASKPNVGPSGDGSPHSHALNSFMHQGSPIPMLSMSMSSPDNFQSMESSGYQGQSGGVLQFIAADGGLQPTSPRTNQTFLCTSSTGEQMQAISMPTVNHYIQVNDSAGNPQLSHIGQSNQSSQPNMIAYGSPRLQPQNYTSYNNVNFLTEPQANYPDGQQLQSQLSRFPNDLAYFPYAPPPPSTLDLQQPTHSAHQSALYSPSASTPKSSTLPPVGYFNPGSNSGGGESSLPSINNNSNTSQAIYNPSYYVNLGSWK